MEKLAFSLGIHRNRYRRFGSQPHHMPIKRPALCPEYVVNVPAGKVNPKVEVKICIAKISTGVEGMKR